jgi:hypothetical protein
MRSLNMELHEDLSWVSVCDVCVLVVVCVGVLGCRRTAVGSWRKVLGSEFVGDQRSQTFRSVRGYP